MMKIMNFADGPKEIKVGQKVTSDDGQGPNRRRIIQYTVQSVGNKLVTMTDGDKFYLEDGRKQSQYTWGRLFSSPEAFEQGEVDDKDISSVERFFYSYKKITPDQARQIKKILGITE